MITLAQHIKIMSYSDNPSGLDSYFRSLDPVDMLELKLEIEQTYPLKPKKVDYSTIPFKAYTKVFDMVLGQFIMVEQIFTGKEDVPKHLFDYSILRLILRPKHHNEFDNTNEQDEIENNKAILDMDVSDAFAILSDFVNDRNRVLFKEFAGVFYEVKDEEEEQEEEKKDDKDEVFEYKFREQWYWYNIVRRLGGENILNYDKVYMLKMELVLPELSFLVQKAKLDKAQEFRDRVARGL